MALFELPSRYSKEIDKQLVKKSTVKNKISVNRKNNISFQLSTIQEMVTKHLGKFKNEYEVVTTEKQLHDFILAAIYQKVISIDTETMGLDPLLDKIVGLCLYTPGQKAVYIPINHTSYITGKRIENQLDPDLISDYLKLLVSYKIDIVMFNAKFDIRVIRNQLCVKDIYCTWDCLLAAKLLNENEPSHALKKLHQKYALNDSEDEFRFDELFKDITFDKVPIDVAYIYAAHDAIITYELYCFQLPYLDMNYIMRNGARKDLQDLSWVFKNIEMPCVPITADMEDNGVEFDSEYQKQLSKKYNDLLTQCLEDFHNTCNNYSEEIDQFKKTHSNHKLEDPINIGSSTQIAQLLYDVLKIEPPDKRNPRGTGEDILNKIDHPITKEILRFREVSKLVSTYIDKLPLCVNPNDKRIHCNFNQYGAKTGRMSSSNPNLQNIPSYNKDIRKLFKASDGFVLLSSDFSQQEPKCLAALCRKHGDSQMYDTFMAGKDLYSEIASKAFNKPYEECLEFNTDGTTNKAGKERRTQAKSILLGALYGRGVPSIAEQLHCSVDKAQKIKDSVFKGFPAIKQFEEDSLNMAYEFGYVTTVCGRKRRLPDLQLDEFEFSYKNGVVNTGDILDFDDFEISNEVPESIRNSYLRRLKRAYFRDKKKIIQEAADNGIIITDNGGKIADAQRQCVNARIQGRRRTNCPYTLNSITQRCA